MVADENSTGDELELAKRCLGKIVRSGEHWYLISSRWYRKWTSFIGYKSHTSSIDDEPVDPGPIDNTDIMKDGNLKRNCLENSDFELVPSELFDYLDKKYGLKSANHALKRKVIAKKTGRGVEYSIEVYPMMLKIKYGSRETKEMEFSKAMKIEDLERNLKKEFSITNGMRLLILANNEYEVIPIDSTIGEEFIMNQEVIVDAKDNIGRWSYIARSGKENGATASNSSYESNHSTYGTSPYNSRNSYGRGSWPEGLRGLNNLGNTCFMNSAIQSLSNVPFLTNFFLKKGCDWEKELNIDNPLGMSGEIARSYADLIENLWSGYGSPFMPRRFKMAVGRFAPQFSGFQQQDAQELMAFLLDGLHEDLNRIKKKPYVEMKDSDGREDKVVADESWDIYQKRNDSIIVDLFHGQLRSEVTCPECKRVSVTFDPFCYLSLPLPAEDSPVYVTLYRNDEPKLVKYGFRAVSDISYAEFLQQLRKVAGVPKTKELIIGEPSPHSSSAVRLFPASGDIEKVNKIPSPIDHSSYRSTTSFVAFEVPPRNSNDLLIWVELNASSSSSSISRHFLVKVPQSNLDNKEEFLYANMADQLLPFALDGIVKSAISEYLSTKNKQNSSNGSDEEGDEDVDEDDSNDNESMDVAGNDIIPKWEEFTEEEKVRIAKKWFSIEKPYSTGYGCSGNRYANVRTIRFKPGFSIQKNWTIEEDPSVLNVKTRSGIQLENCLDLFTKKETLGERDSWYCNKCKKHQRATKKFDLWKLPSVLVIHIKRFGSAHRVWRNKLNTKVNFPLKGMEFEKWTKNKEQVPGSYNLVSVVNHYGSMGGGHYVANALNNIDNNWYNFDDASVTRLSPDQVVSQNAYVVVYVKQPDVQSTDDLMDTD